MPELVIPLINEAFGTAYPQDVSILRGENEHHTVNGKIITDSYLIIGSRKYHLECQSTGNSTMLLPFNIIRYEKLKEQLEKDGSLREELYKEYRNIEKYLEEIFLQKGHEKAFRDMMELISRITGYIFSESEKIKEGLGEIMGGRVLELESDRLIKQGEQIGLERGEQIGLERGERIGLERGEQIGLERGERLGMERGSVEKLTELVMKRMRKGDTPEQIAEFLEEDPDLIRKIYTTVQESAPEDALSRVCEAVLKR